MRRCPQRQVPDTTGGAGYGMISMLTALNINGTGADRQPKRPKFCTGLRLLTQPPG
jgi:hypothetical protein